MNIEVIVKLDHYREIELGNKKQVSTLNRKVTIDDTLVIATLGGLSLTKEISHIEPLRTCGGFYFICSLK